MVDRSGPDGFGGPQPSGGYDVTTPFEDLQSAVGSLFGGPGGGSGAPDFRPLKIAQHAAMMEQMNPAAALAAADQWGKMAEALDTAQNNLKSDGDSLQDQWRSDAARPFMSHVGGSVASLQEWGDAARTNQGRLERLGDAIQTAKTEMDALYAKYKAEVAHIDADTAGPTLLGIDPDEDDMEKMVEEMTQQSLAVMEGLANTLVGTTIQDAGKWAGPKRAQPPSGSRGAPTGAGGGAGGAAPAGPAGGGGRAPSGPRGQAFTDQLTGVAEWVPGPGPTTGTPTAPTGPTVTPPTGPTVAPPPVVPPTLGPPGTTVPPPVVGPPIAPPPPTGGPTAPPTGGSTAPPTGAPPAPPSGAPSPSSGPAPVAPTIPGAAGLVAPGLAGALGAPPAPPNMGGGGSSGPPPAAPNMGGAAPPGPRGMPGAPGGMGGSPISPGTSGLQGRNAPMSPNGMSPGGSAPRGAGAGGVGPQIPGRSGTGRSAMPGGPGMGSSGRPSGPGRSSSGTPNLSGRQAPRVGGVPGGGMTPGAPGTPRSLQGSRAAGRRGPNVGGPIRPGSAASTGMSGLRGRGGGMRAGTPESLQTTRAALRRGLDGRGIVPKAPVSATPAISASRPTSAAPKRNDEDRAAVVEQIVGDEELFVAGKSAPAVIERSAEKVHAKRPGPALGRG